jgi:hypothetical protein
MPEFWHRPKKDRGKEPPPDEHEHREGKLSGLKPLHFEPDDERPTREDVEAREPRSQPGVPGL